MSHDTNTHQETRSNTRLLDFLSAAISVVALAAFTWWWLSLAADSVTAGVA